MKKKGLNSTIKGMTNLFLGLSLFVSNTVGINASYSNTDKTKEEKVKEIEVIEIEEEVNEVEEVVEKREEYSSTYLNSDGTYTTYFYASPIRYQDEKGNLTDIDTSLETLDSKTKKKMSTDYDFKSKSTEVDILLPKEINEETPVVLSWDKYTVKLVPITQESATRKSSAETSNDLESASKSKAKLNKEVVRDIYGKVEEKDTSLIFDAFSDKKVNGDKNAIEIEYVPEVDGIKENIIINQDVGVYRFDFYLELEGYLPKLTDYGAILLLDDKSKKEIGVIPVPLAYDSSSDYGVDYDVVHYELSELEEGYLLTVIVDKEYLEDEDRVYPVIIDPTISLKNTTVVETHINSKNPTVNYYGSGNNVMPVGYGTPQYISRTYMQFPSLNGVIDDKVIISAKFYAKVNAADSKTKPRLERITGTWKASTLKWNNKPGIDYDSDSGTAAMSSGTKNWDITKTVQQWASGEVANYGLCLRTTEESKSRLSYANFFGSRTGTAGNRPYLTVIYEDPSVIEEPIIVGRSNSRLECVLLHP